jgi:hypothetical protein
MSELNLLTTVALMTDVPEKGLFRGQVGTVVERLAPGIYEVEFSDRNGRTYATLAAEASQLLPLLHEPLNQAA